MTPAARGRASVRSMVYAVGPIGRVTARVLLPGLVVGGNGDGADRLEVVARPCSRVRATFYIEAARCAAHRVAVLAVPA